MNQRKELRNFITEHQSPAPRVSIYMPTHRQSPDNRQDPILYKNSVAEAKKMLEEKFPEHDHQQLLKDLEALQEDRSFWNHTTEGLAVLAEQGDVKTFHTESAMPQRVWADEQFDMLPLIQYLDESGTGYLLDLSKDRFELFRVTRTRIAEVEQDEIKSKFSELFDDLDADADLNFGRYGDGGATVYHGHRTKSAEEEKDREKYFRYIDSKLPEVIGEEPVILAGTVDNIAEYKKFAKEDIYTEEAIDKPFDSMNETEQLKAVRDVLTPRYEEQIAKLNERYGTLQSQDKAVADLSAIREHAEAGRIETLLIAEEPAQEDLRTLNDLVAKVVGTGGSIFVVDSSQAPARAILRY